MKYYFLLKKPEEATGKDLTLEINTVGKFDSDEELIVAVSKEINLDKKYIEKISKYKFDKFNNKINLTIR